MSRRARRVGVGQDAKTQGFEAQADLPRQYALGVLAGEELRAFKKALKSDPNLQADVAKWRAQFTALGMDVDTAETSDTVLGHLKREFWSENRLPWRRRLRIWEFALGGVAAALVAYWVAVSGASQSQLPSVLQVQIEAEQGHYSLNAALVVGTTLLRIEQTGGPRTAGRVHELWLLQEDGAFLSLGVLPADRVGALKVSAMQAEFFRDGARLALSEEEAGGANAGLPSDPLRGIGSLRLRALP